jgi:hypothetical protein
MAPDWTPRERAVFRSFASPTDVQRYLDSIPYSTDPFYRSPRRVMRDRRAHCVDGALFAAAALRELGCTARVVWIVAENDDGHLLALFRGGARHSSSQAARRAKQKSRRTGADQGGWGAVGKSNFVGLRYRPPVYRSLRELVMSYFNDYFNSRGDRSMRAYTRPLNLARFDRLRWQTDEAGVDRLIDVELDRLPASPVVNNGQRRWLEPVDRRTLLAGMMGTDARGLFRVK